MEDEVRTEEDEVRAEEEDEDEVTTVVNVGTAVRYPSETQASA